MLLAELVVWHTRPLAPTRRLALGNLVLPTDPPPGLGGLLLGAVVAEHARDVDDDLIPDLHRLIEQVERGDRVVQPRLRHRFQVDRHGLGHSTHRLTQRATTSGSPSTPTGRRWRWCSAPCTPWNDSRSPAGAASGRPCTRRCVGAGRSARR